MYIHIYICVCVCVLAYVVVINDSACSIRKADGHGLLINAVLERMSGTKADCLWQQEGPEGITKPGWGPSLTAISGT